MGPNPLAALSTINPSLIGYMGGYGKAFGALGNSMEKMGQAKLDLEQKDIENKKSNAYLDLQTNYYNDAKTSRDKAEQKAIDTENNQLDAARWVANKYNLPLGEEISGQTDPETYAQNSRVLKGLGIDGIKALTPQERKLKEIIQGMDGTGTKIYTNGDEEPIGASGGQIFNPQRTKTETVFKGGKPFQAVTDILTQRTAYIPLEGQTEDIYKEGVRFENDKKLDGVRTANDLYADTQKRQNKINYDIKTEAANIEKGGGKVINMDTVNKLPERARIEAMSYIRPHESGLNYVPGNVYSDFMKTFGKK